MVGFFLKFLPLWVFFWNIYFLTDNKKTGSGFNWKPHAIQWKTIFSGCFLWNILLAHKKWKWRIKKRYINKWYGYSVCFIRQHDNGHQVPIHSAILFYRMFNKSTLIDRKWLPCALKWAITLELMSTSSGLLNLKQLMISNIVYAIP